MIDRLFETFREADARAQEGLALEALQPLAGKGRVGRRPGQRAAKRPHPELKGSEDVGNAQGALGGDQAGATFDGGEEAGGIVAGDRVDQVVDERHEHGVIRTVQRHRLGGCHQC